MKDIDLVLDNRDNARVLLTAFQTMLDNSSDMIFIKDQNLTYLAVTMSFVRMTAKQTLDDVIGHTDFDLFEDQDLAARYVEDDRKIFAAGQDMIGFNEPLPDENGVPRYGNTTKHVLRDRNGTIIGLLGLTRDITREVVAQQHYQKELEYLFELPQDAYAAIFLDIYDWRIISQREQAVEGLRLPLGHSIEVLLNDAIQHVSPTSAAHAFYRDFAQDSLYDIYDSGKRNVTLEYPRSMPDGRQHWLQTNITFLRDPVTSHLCAMLVIRDIDAKKQAEEQILRLAETDEMTGLFNRSATMKQIRSFLSGEGKDGDHALLIVDVDNFKEINDTYGHLAGDQCLVLLANAIQRCFRASDIVGRIGGDEFFVLMKHVPSLDNVSQKASMLLEEMQAAAAGQPWKVSGSVGISLYRGSQSSSTLEQLYDQADQALYRAKNQGKNRVVFAPDGEKF